MVTAWFLLGILTFLTLRMLFWGFAKKERVLQFPTLFGAAWLLFMIPQIIGCLSNPTKLPQEALEDGGAEIAVLMCCCCALAGWLGYFSGMRKPPHQEGIVKSYSLDRLTLWGTVLMLIAWWGAAGVASLYGGFRAQFIDGAPCEVVWLGAPVMYNFFAVLMFPALVLLFTAYLCRPSMPRLLLVISAAAYPAAMALLLGRRSRMAMLGLTAIGCLYLIRRWTPPRVVLAIGSLGMAAFVIIAPLYRHSSQSERLRRLSEIRLADEVRQEFEGDSYAEFDFMIIQSAAINRTLAFDLGTGFYNSTVAQLVPRQIVGNRVKEALMLGSPLGSASTSELYGWNVPYGSNPTGMLNAFSSFWFFGAFLYYGAAWVCARLWQRAEGGDLRAKIFIVIFAPLIPVSVVGSLFIMPTQILLLLLSVWPAFSVTRRSEPMKGSLGKGNRELNAIRSSYRDAQ